MADIITGPAIPPTTDDPWPSCDVWPIILGTGTVYIRNALTGIDEDAGNFDFVGFAGDGTAERIFLPAEEVQSVVGITDLHRFTLRGDSFSLRQLERLLNQDRISTASADVIPLSTVREMNTHQVRFTKTINADPCEVAECPDLEIIFWRAYFEIPFSYEFERDTPTIHTFTMISLPDAVNHPTQAFGRVTVACPVALDVLS